MKSHHHRITGRRGLTMGLTLIVAITLTGLVAALSWTAGAQSKMTTDLSKSDQAFYAAEAGAQRVAWYIKHNSTYHDGSGNLVSPFNSTTFFTGTFGSYAYKATCATVSSTDLRLVVTSVATSGNVSYSMSMYMSPPSQGVPTFATASNWDNKNVTVTGDVQTAGVFTNSGNGSISGNLYYGDTSSTGVNVAAGVARYVDPSNPSDPNTFHQLAWTAADGATNVQDTLNAVVALEGSPALFTTDQNNKTFDFTQLSGSNKVYKVVGNVTDPTIIGSGTLFVVGSVSFTKNVTLGDSSNPVNLVSMGAVNNLTFDKKATIYGSLYAQGNWNRAQTDVHGMVYVQGTITSNNGSSTLDATGISVPFFDTRAPAGSAVSSPLSITHFSGPQP